MWVNLPVMSPDTPPNVRVLSEAESVLARELAAAQRTIHVLTSTIQVLTQQPALVGSLQPEVLRLQMEVAQLRIELQNELRQKSERAARVQRTIDQLDASLQQMLLARDEAVRAADAT